MRTNIVLACEPQAYRLAIQLLSSARPVAFPTDTVYGLGAAYDNPQAIEALYVIKGRDTAKAIAVLIGSPEALELVTGPINDRAQQLTERYWPGPLTLVLPRRQGLPDNLSPRHTIGVRMPNHPVALELLRQCGPLAVTSANLSGMPDARTAQEVEAQLSGRIPLILDGGRTPGGMPSTVVDCTGAELALIRPGPISIDDLYISPR
jgi:L-threonylcarbamoyladenylate synthase